MSLCRQNYHEECESALNKQINTHLAASYTYSSLAWYFDRDTVALKGFHSFFQKLSEQERGDADKVDNISTSLVTSLTLSKFLADVLSEQTRRQNSTG